MANISFVGARGDSGIHASNGSRRVYYPSGVTVGDVAILMCTQGDIDGGMEADNRFTLLRTTSPHYSIEQKTWYRVLDGSEPSYEDIQYMDQTSAAIMLVYRGVDNLSPIASHSALTGVGTNITAPSRSTQDGDQFIALFTIRRDGYSFSTPAGMIHRHTETEASVPLASFDMSSNGGTKGPFTSTYNTPYDNEDNIGTSIVLRAGNFAPNAPTLVFPTSGETVAVDQSNVLDWDFNDPDAGDSQSKAAGEIRSAGGAVVYSWDEETISTQHTLPADTLAAGDYEWRVKTYDAQGVEGPWSSWEPFSGAVAPGSPTITSHANNQIVSQETELLEWSTSEQEAYQGQKVADNAGAIDTSTIYWDSGIIESSTSRSRNVDFPTNDRFEWIRWRIRRDGLWSPWAEVRVEVSYTVPATPVVSTTENDSNGNIVVSITNPTPGAGEPTVESNDIEKRLTTEDPWIRVATDVAANGSFTDYNVASGSSPQYRARAYGDNGTSSLSSSVTSSGIILKGSWVHPVADPNAGARFRYNGQGGTDNWTPTVSLRHFAGRRLPVSEYGEHDDESVSVDLVLDGQDEIDNILRLAKLQQILCYRDAFGRLVYGIIPQLSLGSRFYGADTSVTIEAVDYSEEV